MDHDFFPDGLTKPGIDALIQEIFSEERPVLGVPSPFADRETDIRRERRRSNRSHARTMRALGLHLRTAPVAVTPVDEVA